MNLRFLLAHLVRDSRGARGRLAFFGLCLAIGVAAVVTVAALADRLDRQVRLEAKRLLGADLAVSGSRPIPDDLLDTSGVIGDTSRVRELATMVVSRRGESPRSQLVELKAVDASYPLYGSIETIPNVAYDQLHTESIAVVAADLLDRLDIEVGDEIDLGQTTVTVAGVLDREPDRLVTAFTLGPRVLIGAEAFEASGLETFGSRIDHRLLVRLPDNPDHEAVAEAEAATEAALRDQPTFRVTTYVEVTEALSNALRRLEGFLGLVALLSLLVGGVGVAQSIRSFLERRLTSIAVLETIGVRPREAVGLYLAQSLGLGLGGSLLGVAVGLTFNSLAPAVLGDLVLLSTDPWWQPQVAARGLVLGLAMTLLAALGPLTSVARIPPILALRREAEPLPLARGTAVVLGGVALAGFVTIAASQAESWLRGAAFSAALALTTALLVAAALGVRRGCRWLRSLPLPLPVRHGAALAGRPGPTTLAAVVALGLGVLVVLTTVLVQRQLTSALEADLPDDAPTAFLVDIQPDQWPDVAAILGNHDADSIDSVPVVMARLRSIDGTTADSLGDEAEAGSDRRWALTREQRLTYLDRLPEDNEVVAGELWGDPALDELSLEVEFARELDVGIGSKLLFDVQGVPIELTVTSLRSVDWRTFRINFFLVVEPGVLEQAPQSRLAVAAIPKTRSQAAQDSIAALYPNVTLVDIRSLLERIAAILGQLASAVRLLGGFTALAGLAILFGAVAADTARRGREAALLKTLGFTRGTVLATFATELALTGLASGAIGAGGAVLVSWMVVTFGFELDASLQPAITGLALVIVVGAVTVAGLAASLPALQRRPSDVFRSDRG